MNQLSKSTVELKEWNEMYQISEKEIEALKKTKADADALAFECLSQRNQCFKREENQTPSLLDQLIIPVSAFVAGVALGWAAFHR